MYFRTVTNMDLMYIIIISIYCLNEWVLCDKTFPGEMQYRSLLIPERKLMTNQSPAWWTDGFYCGYFHGYGKGLLTGTKMTKTAVSPNPIPGWVTDYESWKPMGHCPTCRQHNGWLEECPLCVVWLFWVFFQTILLVSVSLRQFNLSQSDCQQSLQFIYS